MIDFGKANRFGYDWMRALMDACDVEFGDDGEIVFARTIGAIVGQTFRVYDPAIVAEHCNETLAIAKAPYRLSRIS